MVGVYTLSTWQLLPAAKVRILFHVPVSPEIPTNTNQGGGSQRSHARGIKVLGFLDTRDELGYFIGINLYVFLMVVLDVVVFL